MHVHVNVVFEIKETSVDYHSFFLRVYKQSASA